MTFEYDTLNAPGVVTSAAALQSIAVQLLDGLVKIRKENNVRPSLPPSSAELRCNQGTSPIVFLCHSFGGIIVKQVGPSCLLY